MKHAALILLFGLGACVAARETVPPIGTASKASDFDSYKLHRVGLLMPSGEGVDPEFLRALQNDLSSAFAASTHYEIVPLSAADMEAIERLEPLSTGRVRPAPVLALARRSALDAVITTRVLELKPYTPVRLALGIDLIAVETGQVTWSSSVCIDTTDRDTQAAIQAWQSAIRGVGETERALDVMSPMRVAEFAAMQAAMLL